MSGFANFRSVLSLIWLVISRPHKVGTFLLGSRQVEFSLDEIESRIGKPRYIFEAGACDGSDSLAFLDRWPEASLVACEPVPELFDKARHRLNAFKDRVVLYPSALGPQGVRIAEMHLGERQHHSASALEPTLHKAVFPKVDFVRSITVEVVTLDDLWIAAGEPSVDLLWLDLQGFELKALSSGERALNATKAAVIEVSAVRLYRGAPVVEEVVEFMNQRGFACVEVRVPIIAGNAFFVRSNTPVLTDGGMMRE